jgi:hypothetical protein
MTNPALKSQPHGVITVKECGISVHLRWQGLVARAGKIRVVMTAPSGARPELGRFGLALPPIIPKHLWRTVRGVAGAILAACIICAAAPGRRPSGQHLHGAGRGAAAAGRRRRGGAQGQRRRPGRGDACLRRADGDRRRGKGRSRRRSDRRLCRRARVRDRRRWRALRCRRSRGDGRRRRRHHPRRNTFSCAKVAGDLVYLRSAPSSAIIRTSEHFHVFLPPPRLSVRMFGSGGKKRANA